jgi:hypothetical protein
MIWAENAAYREDDNEKKISRKPQVKNIREDNTIYAN